jgi:phytoene dehydrogenase-like protein
VHRDVIIIGGGHNGLVAAAFLAKAGMKPLVLERADRAGGCATTTELAPGFRCPTLGHRAAIDPAIVRALDLERHGLRIIAPQALVSAPSADGRALMLWRETGAAVREIRSFSSRDAERYASFIEAIAAVGEVLRSLMARQPPAIDRLAWSDLVGLLKVGRSVRALGRTDAHRLLRWAPMAVGDLVSEWFESEPLGAAVAAGGLLGSFLGPRSPGSAAVFLMLAARERHPISPGWAVRGGMGALAEALCGTARRAGAEIRTGAEVRHITIRHGEATGVVLASGEELQARHVLSNADPRRTLLELVGSEHLSPELVRQVQHIRMRGTLAKVNFALSSLPRFEAWRTIDRQRETAALSGCIRLGTSMQAIERAFDAAKYGGMSDEPWIELTVPSLTDASLAPEGRHVTSTYVQYAPYTLRGTSWDDEREHLGAVVTRTIAKHAPGFEELIVAREVITPLDLERRFGLTGGHIFHGELGLDQLLFARPLLGWAGGRTPVRHLYLCGSGAHPGTGLDGRCGALAAKEVLKAARLR